MKHDWQPTYAANRTPSICIMPLPHTFIGFNFQTYIYIYIYLFFVPLMVTYSSSVFYMPLLCSFFIPAHIRLRGVENRKHTSLNNGVLNRLRTLAFQNSTTNVKKSHYNDSRADLFVHWNLSCLFGFLWCFCFNFNFNF